MPTILKQDYVRYIPKEQLRIQRKYGGSIGKAFYLPRGEGLTDLFAFFNSHKDNLKAINDTVSGVTNTVNSIGKATTDTMKGIEEIKGMRIKNQQIAQPQQAITEQALKNIINNEEGFIPKVVHRVPKNAGAGFYYE
jgi:CRISPR/Cas system CMR-associated protein Cmr5 small subunit